VTVTSWYLPLLLALQVLPAQQVQQVQLAQWLAAAAAVAE